MIKIRRYPEQRYTCYFDNNTGLFARVEDQGTAHPFWAEKGPELLDISITNWCDRECDICYRSSHRKGRHMPLADYEKLLEQASEMNLFQVALGGGNPNQHPHFEKILRLTRQKYGIIPSYTTNGRGLNEKVVRATKEYCGAVAVSLYPPYKELEKNITILQSYSIKTNLHFVLSTQTIPLAIKWLKNIPIFLRGLNAIIFLTYKPVGIKADDSLVMTNSQMLERFYETISSSQFPFKIGFDSCGVSSIVDYIDYNETLVEACEAARFSAFISEDMKMYPCSFMIDSIEGISILSNPMNDIWKNDINFKNIRNRLRRNECANCTKYEDCLGGCPVFDKINICRIRSHQRENTHKSLKEYDQIKML